MRHTSRRRRLLRMHAFRIIHGRGVNLVNRWFIQIIADYKVGAVVIDRRSTITNESRLPVNPSYRVSYSTNPQVMAEREATEVAATWGRYRGPNCHLAS